MPNILLLLQPYQWLKDKIMSEDGRKQQAKLKDLAHIAEKLGCTLPQLAIGKRWHEHPKTFAGPLHTVRYINATISTIETFPIPDH